MAFSETLNAALKSIWEITELKVFIVIVIVGILLYFILVYLKPFLKWLITLMHTKKTEHPYMPKDIFKTPHKEHNIEIYREDVEWSEKPVFAVAVQQKFLERCGYGIVIIVLVVLIARNFV